MIGKLLDQHQSGARDHSAALWSLSMLEAFLRRVHAGGAALEVEPGEALGMIA